MKTALVPWVGALGGQSYRGLYRQVTLLLTALGLVVGSQDAKRLYDDLLTNYNRLIRPVYNNSDKLTVKLGLKLSQLIDVNLKNQIMTTNVWVEQEWHDYKLAWNPEEYGGVQTLYVPSEHIWLPDIVLYNNADGNYEVTIMTKAKLYHTGKVRWKPPAIYKSSCQIDVEYFPFDEQTCFMKFGSWTYDGYMVDLRHLKQQPNSDVIDIGIDLRDYYLSVEWDIMKVPAERFEKFYSCCEEPYPDIKFNITLRRKTLFYTVNLIIPCVGITFLSVLVFYLPSDSGEKVSLSISILLSLTVFFLLLAEIIPPTSLTVPLLGKYLLFTMVLVTFSVMATIGVLNVNFRSPSTHRMAPWVKSIFVEFLPRILFIQRPQVDDDDNDIIGVNGFCGTGGPLIDYSQKQVSPVFEFSAGPSPEGFDPGNFEPPFGLPMEDDVIQQDILDDTIASFPEPHQSAELERAIIGVQFIAQHMKNEDKFSSIAEDWKYVAMVLDRLFLWLFTLACVLGTAGIILSAPTLWDKRNPIDIKLSKIAQRKLNLIPSNEL